MKIYEFKGFPNPARVRIALAEKGLFEKADFVSVNVPEGEHREAAYKAINPSGVVPALQLDDGTVISECSAITEYLDHSAGEPTLTGKNAQQRAFIHMQQRKVEAGLLDAVSTYFHHATPGLGPKLETNQNAEWGQRQRDTAVATMHWLDGELGKRSYVAGDDFSVADITAMGGLMFAGFAEIAIPDECANLKSWHARVSARPSVAQAA